MKSSKLPFAALLLSAFLPLSFFGCAKPTESVDVSAQTAALKSADKEVRISACVELAKAGPKAVSAVPALLPLMKDADAEVRRLASYALMEIGPEAKAAIPGIREHLNDPDRLVALQAINTLRAIDPTAKDLRAPPNVMTEAKP